MLLAKCCKLWKKGKTQSSWTAPEMAVSGLCESLKINRECFFLNGLLIHSGLKLGSLSVLEGGSVKLHF